MFSEKASFGVLRRIEQATVLPSFHRIPLGFQQTLATRDVEVQDEATYLDVYLLQKRLHHNLPLLAENIRSGERAIEDSENTESEIIRQKPYQKRTSILADRSACVHRKRFAVLIRDMISLKEITRVHSQTAASVNVNIVG